MMHEAIDKPAILLIGSGGHSHACIDAIEQDGRFRIFGLVCSDGEDHADRLGYAVVGSDAHLPALALKCRNAIIAVGQIRSPEPRMRLFMQAQNLGLGLPAIVSGRAYVSPHARLGPGTLVMHGAIINAGAIVGSNCIVNSNALIEHDAQVGDHCHIATGAILNGGVQVGTGSFIGSGSVVREGVRIGSCCLVGMGQSVRHPMTDHEHQWAKDRRL